MWSHDCRKVSVGCCGCAVPYCGSVVKVKKAVRCNRGDRMDRTASAAADKVAKDDAAHTLAVDKVLAQKRVIEEAVVGMHACLGRMTRAQLVSLYVSMAGGKAPPSSMTKPEVAAQLSNSLVRQSVAEGALHAAQEQARSTATRVAVAKSSPAWREHAPTVSNSSSSSVE